MRDNWDSDKRRKLLASAAIAVFIIFIILAGIFIGRPMIRFVSEPEKFRAWVDGHGIWGKVMYSVMVLIQVFVAFIPGEPLEIGGGYAFGAVEGTLLCLAGATLGSIIVFLLVRRFGIKLVEVFFSKEKIQSLKFLHSSGRKSFLFFIIFMIPGTPKDLLCYFAGLTDMKFTVWLLICSLGRLPSIVTSTIGGDALGIQNYIFAIASFAVTILISIAGLLIYRAICKRSGDKK